MILGTGIDILHANRLLPENTAPGDPFLKKVFTEAEIRQANACADPQDYYARRFSCKEAVFKALHISPNAVHFSEIEILDDSDGFPVCTLTGRLREAVSRKGCCRVHVSISREGESILSAALLETEGATQMSLIDELIAKAKQHPKKVALPECEADKTLLAARRVLDEGIGYPVLVNDPAVITETAARCGVSTDGMTIVDTTDEAAQDALVQRYMGYDKLILSAKGAKRKMKNPMYYAMILEAVGDVDAVFCGHVNTTGDVLIAAQQCIGMQDGVDVPSIFALTDIPNFSGSEGNIIAMADCGLNQEPSAEELASIAIATCDNVRAMMGWEPRCAFLSFSTCGSGSSASVEKVTAAIQIVRERRPDLKVDGEFQLDAALRPEVAAKKVPHPSEVAGKANILIFPDLNAANIGIKMVQLFAGGKGYGHTLSGFARPVADSSRGASVEEIVGDIAMVAIAAEK